MPEELHSVTPAAEHNKALSATDTWSSDVALERVKADFTTAETFRRQNHDWRFNTADELYLGYVRQKYWEGTKVPRSSLATYLLMEQVESFLPKVITVMFGESYWFDARPYPAVNINEARAVQELLLAQLREVNGSTGIREVFRRSIKSALQYCNGYIYLGWKRYKTLKPRFDDILVPITRPVNMGGVTFDAPTGKHQRFVMETNEEIEVNEPELRYVSVRDAYVDPKCSSPNPRDGRYFIERDLVAISDLQALRETPGMSIPPDAQLLALAQEKPFSASDQGRQIQEGLRGAAYHNQNDYASAGEMQCVERLRYWSGDRLVWVLGRKHAAYNIPNPYGKIPYYCIPYADVLDRHYCLSMADVLEPEQRLQQALINAQLDELSLYFNKPITKKRGQPLPLSQQRRRPGLVREADDPEKDIVVEDNKPLLTDTYIQIGASEQRSQRRTGVSEIALQGTQSQGSSITRTATGVGAITAGSLSRVGYFVENVQETVVVPMLDDLLLYNKRFNTSQGILQFLGAEGQVIELEPQVLRRAELRFEMRASNKANSRAAMLGQLPLVIEGLLNPNLLSLLHQTGKTIDVNEVYNIFLDATNYRPHKSALVRDLTPEEMQAMQQQSIDQTKILTQQIRGDNQLEVAQERESASIAKEIIRLRGELQKALIVARSRPQLKEKNA